MIHLIGELCEAHIHSSRGTEFLRAVELYEKIQWCESTGPLRQLEKWLKERYIRPGIRGFRRRRIYSYRIKGGEAFVLQVPWRNVDLRIKRYKGVVFGWVLAENLEEAEDIVYSYRSLMK